MVYGILFAWAWLAVLAAFLERREPKFTGQ